MIALDQFGHKPTARTAPPTTPVAGLDTYRGLECSICEQTFDDLDQFRDHTFDGQPCPGGSSDA